MKGVLFLELYKEILAHALAYEPLQITFPTLWLNAEQIVEGECYKAILKIKEVLKDSNLEDAECFRKIEEIICVFEDIGSSCGSRHDFG